MLMRAGRSSEVRGMDVSLAGFCVRRAGTANPMQSGVRCQGRLGERLDIVDESVGSLHRGFLIAFRDRARHRRVQRCGQGHVRNLFVVHIPEAAREALDLPNRVCYEVISCRIRG